MPQNPFFAQTGALLLLGEDVSYIYLYTYTN